MKRCLLPLLIFGCWISSIGCHVPPEDELEAAQRQIGLAREKEANLYAPSVLREAEELLSEASLKISEKSYQEARTLANQARAKAEQAETVAMENQASSRQRSIKFLSEAEGKLSEFKARMEALTGQGSAVRARLLQEALDAESLLQLYRDKIAAERFSETENVEGVLQQKLQQLEADLESVALPERKRKK